MGVSKGVESDVSKAASASAACARAGEPLPTSDCPLGHGLAQEVAWGSWGCDVCGDVVDEGAAVKWCSRCEYAVCSSCQGAGGGGGGGKKRGKKGKKGRGRK